MSGIHTKNETILKKKLLMRFFLKTPAEDDHFHLVPWSPTENFHFDPGN